MSLEVAKLAYLAQYPKNWIIDTIEEIEIIIIIIICIGDIIYILDTIEVIDVNDIIDLRPCFVRKLGVTVKVYCFGDL